VDGVAGGEGKAGVVGLRLEAGAVDDRHQLLCLSTVVRKSRWTM
jgi:hypothetical protein